MMVFETLSRYIASELSFSHQTVNYFLSAVIDILVKIPIDVPINKWEKNIFSHVI